MRSRKHYKNPQKAKYKILHKDNEIVVVDKPAGLLTVPIPRIKAVNLEYLLNKQLDPQNSEIQAAHRIDRYTSGIVVFARNRKAHRNLMMQFRNHTPDRVYLAIVRGCPTKKEDILKHHMKRVKQGFRNIVVPASDEEGTQARLRYVVLQPGEEKSLVKIFLDTGLKNQIRVQFAEIGHPLVGDRHYSSKEKFNSNLDRQALHAAELTFDHPATGERVTFLSDLPKDLKFELKS